MKEQAARSGRTVGAVIEDGLRRAFAPEPAGPVEPLGELPTHGGGGVLAGVDLTSNPALREVMDAGEAVDALR
ncbi:MAG: ribbon-helix-helix domain-containing protein [Acidimicrobiales bacterium]